MTTIRRIKVNDTDLRFEIYEQVDTSEQLVSVYLRSEVSNKVQWYKINADGVGQIHIPISESIGNSVELIHLGLENLFVAENNVV